MAQELFRIHGGLEIDGLSQYLAGEGAPGAGASGLAPISSYYTDSSNGAFYVKVSAGAGADKWRALATEEYVSNLTTSGISWREPVRVIASDDVLPVGAPGEDITVDGEEISEGGRVLFANLASGSANVYVYDKSAGAFTETNNELSAGDTVYVVAGTEQGKTYQYNSDGQWIWINSNGDAAIDELTQRVDVVEDKVQHLEDVTVPDLQQGLGAVSSRVTTAESDIDAVEGRVTATESDIVDVKADLVAVNGALDTLDTAVGSLDARVDVLETNLVGVTAARIDQIEADVSAAQTDIESAEVRIGSVETGLSAANERLDVAEDEIDALQSDVAGIAARVSVAEADLELTSKLGVFTDVSGVTVLDSTASQLVEWDVYVKKADGTDVYATKVFAAHNGLTVDFTRFATLKIGNISELAINAVLTDGELQLTIASGDVVNVTVRRVTAI